MKKRRKYGIDINPNFLDSLNDGEAHWCPHCGQQASFKKHIANKSLVTFLSLLECATIDKGEGFYTSKDLIPRVKHSLQKVSTDAVSTARYMKLVEVADDAVLNGGEAPVGTYRMLPLGRAFLMSKQDVPEYVLAYNATVVAKAPECVSVSQANCKFFNYARDVQGIQAPSHSGGGIPVGK